MSSGAIPTASGPAGAVTLKSSAGEEISKYTYPVRRKIKLHDMSSYWLCRARR